MCANQRIKGVRNLPEYDLHSRGMRVDDATSGLIPNDYKRCPNPGIVFIAV